VATVTQIFSPRGHVAPLRATTEVTRVCATIVAALMLVFPLRTSAATGETWFASSHNATSITGEIRFSETRIRFSTGESLLIHRIRRVLASEDSGVIGASRSVDTQGVFTLYRVDSQAIPHLIRNNALCGLKTRVRYLGVRSYGRTRVLAAYDADIEHAAEPSGGTPACALFYYSI
jgi:hypothetical protein